MAKNLYAPKMDDLPPIIPIFPLRDVLLLPSGHLPLNIFEPRYVAMVEAAMADARLIGMILPKDTNRSCGAPHVYNIGCAGKIIEFSETADGRFLIGLHGVARFKVKRELDTQNGFRRVEVLWDDFAHDLNQPACRDLDRTRLRALLKVYFRRRDMACDWDRISAISDAKLITCLSMICPFSAQEKQALMESGCCNTRAELLTTLLEMAVCGDPNDPCAASH